MNPQSVSEVRVARMRPNWIRIISLVIIFAVVITASGFTTASASSSVAVTPPEEWIEAGFDCTLSAETPTFCPPIMEVDPGQGLFINFTSGTEETLFQAFDANTSAFLGSDILQPGDLDRLIYVNTGQVSDRARIEATSLESQRIRGSYFVQSTDEEVPAPQDLEDLLLTR